MRAEHWFQKSGGHSELKKQHKNIKEKQTWIDLIWLLLKTQTDVKVQTCWRTATCVKLQCVNIWPEPFWCVLEQVAQLLPGLEGPFGCSSFTSTSPEGRDEHISIKSPIIMNLNSSQTLRTLAPRCINPVDFWRHFVALSLFNEGLNRLQQPVTEECTAQ